MMPVDWLRIAEQVAMSAIVIALVCFVCGIGLAHLTMPRDE